MSFDVKHMSRALTDGPERAAARAYLKGIGYDDEALAKPIIGVASTWIETMPCNFPLRWPAAPVKEGIRGHEDVAGLARGDRRLDRARRARPLFRRDDRAVGL